MKTLLVRFEKQILHYTFLDNLDSLNIEMNNLPIGWAGSDWENYSRLLEELSLLNSTYNPDLIVYHSSLKTPRGLDEIRYSNEAFLKYFSFTNKIDLLEVNKVICRRKLDIKQIIFKENFISMSKNLTDKEWIAKTNLLLDWLTFLLLIKDVI